MAEVEDGDNTHNHQVRMNNLPRDLLKRFLASSHRRNHRSPLPLPVVRSNHAVAQVEETKEEDKEEEELELSLGLSMNGRFGVDPTAKKIKRTTSIPEFVNHEEMVGYVVPVASGSLIRTCSLPTETEEQWRKRKELQTLRRMEAKKKRSEKQRNLKAMRERNLGLSEEVVGLEGGGGGGDGGGLRRTTSLTTRVGGLGLNCEKEKGGSSSDSDGQQHGQGTIPMDTTSPIATNLLPNEPKSPVTPEVRARAGVTENSGKVAAVTMRSLPSQHSEPQNRSKEMVKNLLEDMPSVSTKGEGPNGKRIEGFLYRYGKGEEVRILCVCHGSFLTPAEFVKHAGGTDVANPLKQIVVSPSFL